MPHKTPPGTKTTIAKRKGVERLCDAPLGTRRLKNGVRKSKGTCTRPAGLNTDHEGWGRCNTHRGNEPVHIRAAALQEARWLASRFGNELAIDPHDALRAELARTNGMVKWATQMTRLIMDKENVNPQNVVKDYRFLAYKEILDEERDRLVRIARSCLDSNVAERKQMLSEALAAIVVDSFHHMIRSIPDLTPTQIAAAQEIITLELTEKAGEMVYSVPE